MIAAVILALDLTGTGAVVINGPPIIMSPAAVNLCPVVSAPVYGTLDSFDESRICSIALMEAGCPGCSQAIQWEPSGGQYEQIMRCEGQHCVHQGTTAYWNKYRLEQGKWVQDRTISYWYPSWDVQTPVEGTKYHYFHRPCSLDQRVCEGPWLGIPEYGGIPYVAIDTWCYDWTGRVECP